MDVAEWLRQLGLERYEVAFRDAEVSADILPDLTEADLEKLGLPLGPRKKLLKAISSLEPPASPAAEAPFPPRPAVADRRQVTIMFVDLVGSTMLSRRLDTEDYRAVIAGFQDTVSLSVSRFDGHVAKYLGDGVMACFGYPRAHEDDAERAIRAALEALQAVRGLRPPPGVMLRARIGIATGVEAVGELAEVRSPEQGAILGHTPNLASRLQGVADPGGIIVGQRTHALVEGLFDCEALGPQSLKGIAEPEPVWRIVGERRSESRFEARHGAGLTPYVGREDEIELLVRRWGRAKDGEGQIVLISGEAGLGKSRLAQRLRERLAGEPHLRLHYQCSPHHTNSALYPVSAQIAFAAGIGNDDPVPAKLDKLEALLEDGTDDVAAVAPLIADLLSIPNDGRYPATSLTPQAKKALTLDILNEQLVGLARKRPVLVLFEDLHWVDPTSQELLELMVDRIRGSPVLVLMTFRPEYAPKWVGQAHVTLIALSRLPRRECIEMVSTVAGQTALTPAALNAIVAKAEGLPLFLEEVTRDYLESGRADAIPSSIQASLLARLDRLGPAKEVAQAGAAIGREFDHQLLARVLPLDEVELTDALDRLTASELVFRRGTPPSATFSFKHALVQDAAYESLLKGRRRSLHAAIAEAIRAQHPEIEVTQPELLAHHYSRAALAGPATAYWEKAGNRALERSANVEAVEHFRAGIALLDELPREERPRVELALEIGLGSGLTSVEGYGTAATGSAYERARQLCLQLGDRQRLLPVLYGLWNFEVAAGRHTAARQLAGEMLQRAEDGGNSGQRVAAHSALSAILTFCGLWADGKAHAERCIALHDPVEHESLKLDYAEDPCVQAHIVHGLCCWFLGSPDRALQSALRAVSLGRQLRHANTIGYAMAGVAWVYCLRGEIGRCLSAAEDAIAFGHEMALPAWSAFPRTVRGWALSRQGNAADGIPEIAAGIKVWLGTGGAVMSTFHQAILADAYMAAGRHDQAQEVADRGLQFAADQGEGFAEAELHRLRGLALMARPQASPAEAELSFLRSLQVSRDQQAPGIELRAAVALARLWREQRRADEAHALLQPLRATFKEGFDTADLTAATALLKELAEERRGIDIGGMS